MGKSERKRRALWALAVVDGVILAAVIVWWADVRGFIEEGYSYYAESPLRVLIPVAIACTVAGAMWSYCRITPRRKRAVAVVGLAVASAYLTVQAGWFIYMEVGLLLSAQELPPYARQFVMPAAFELLLIARSIGLLLLALGGWYLLVRLLRSSWGLKERQRSQ